MIDITPKQNNATQILFVQDESRVYDFVAHRRVDNVRLSLRNDPLIEEFFTAKARVFEYEEACSLGTGQHMRYNQQEYAALREEAERKLIQLIKRYIGPNDPCFCGSGRKIKYCHGMNSIDDFASRKIAQRMTQAPQDLG